MRENDFSIQPELNRILGNCSISGANSQLGNFLGFLAGMVLPDPISWLVGPFITLWSLQADIKRIQLKQQQIKHASAVAQAKIRAELKIRLQELKNHRNNVQQQAANFKRLIQEHRHKFKAMDNQLGNILSKINVETDPLKIIAYGKIAEILSKGMAGNFNSLIDAFLYVSRNTRSSAQKAIDNCILMLKG
jgi:hypothetical protein